MLQVGSTPPAAAAATTVVAAATGTAKGGGGGDGDMDEISNVLDKYALENEWC